MNELDLTCRDERRRQAVRQAPLNGLDYLEVSDDQRTLTAFFLGKAPENLVRENVRIEGGQRIRSIRVDAVEIHRNPDPELDDSVEIRVDRSGDFSHYILKLVDLDEAGRPTDRPMSGFDPRYSRLEFSFKVGCPSDLDCAQEVPCPPVDRTEPEINYLAKDYASFRQLILDRLALIMPDWKERHVPDLGIALVELLAYVGDYLSYYQDAVATEAYLDTARQRISVRRHVRLVDYPMHEGCNARAWVSIETNSDIDDLPVKSVSFVTSPGDAGGESVLPAEQLRSLPYGTYDVFEPLLDKRQEFLSLRADHSEIRFHTWGDRECCLPKGTTRATLLDEWVRSETPPARRLDLRGGDTLIFEEVLGPNTGNPADADPAHRQAVRLTSAEKAVDPLSNQPIVEIEWAEEDALVFPLCLSSLGPAPDCNLFENVSVARGNVILVDHGRTIRGESLGRVPTKESVEPCDLCGCPSEATVGAEHYRPHLVAKPLTFSQPLPLHAPASGLLTQEPGRALPQVRLTGTLAGLGTDVIETEWLPQRDLLASGSRDAHYVAEMDDVGRAYLRFGNGELGKAPEADTTFHATYRVGNGPVGNVGAEAISCMILEEITLSGVGLRVRNPLPAEGGIAPEPLTEIKLFAPHAFRAKLERAITGADYARLAELYPDERHPKVQRAAGSLRWTGSWYEALVPIDPLGKPEADEELLKGIEAYLHPYRRVGHDLVVAAAHYVPLDVEILVCVLPGHQRGHVKAALLDLFSNRVMPDGRRGFFHPDNLSFGEGVALSRMVATAQSMPGVESVWVTKLERLREGPSGEVEAGILRLGALEVARLDNDPNQPENGLLRLEMRGGR